MTVAEPEGAATGGERISGLDLWRALLMGGGLFVHGSIGLQPVPLFQAIGGISETFRMGVFFILSGFLSALALQRRDRRAWLRGRLIHLGIPATFGVLVLSPVIFWLFRSAPASAFGAPRFLFEWHHLWFLFGLLSYALVAAAMDGSPSVTRLIARVDGDMGPRGGRIAILATAAIAAPLMAAAMPLLQYSLSPPRFKVLAVAELIPGYLPMFALGFVLARAPGLRRSVMAAGGFAVAVVAAIIIANIAVRTVEAAVPFAGQVRFVSVVLCPPAMFALILRSAMAIRRIPAWLHRVSDASYTVYLLHFPIIVLFSTQLVAGWNPYLAYGWNIVGAGGLAYLVHRTFVRRSGLLSLLLNGRALPRASQMARPAAA